MSQLLRFRLVHLFIATATIAITIVFPAATFVFLLALLLLFIYVALTTVHNALVLKTSKRPKLINGAFLLAHYFAILSIVGWAASSFWLVRHHVQGVATIDIGPYAIGLTVGEYYTADARWSVVPASWMAPVNWPRIQLPATPPPYRQSFEMWIPFWLLTAIPIGLLVLVYSLRKKLLTSLS